MPNSPRIHRHLLQPAVVRGKAAEVPTVASRLHLYRNLLLKSDDLTLKLVPVTTGHMTGVLDVNILFSKQHQKVCTGLHLTVVPPCKQQSCLAFRSLGAAPSSEAVMVVTDSSTNC